MPQTFFIFKPSKFVTMKLTITTTDCKSSDGFHEAIKTAFAYSNLWATDIVVKHGRIDGKREGYPVIFSINGFSPRNYQNLLYGEEKCYTCEVTAISIPVTSTV